MSTHTRIPGQSCSYKVVSAHSVRKILILVHTFSGSVESFFVSSYTFPGSPDRFPGPPGTPDTFPGHIGPFP